MSAIPEKWARDYAVAAFAAAAGGSGAFAVAVAFAFAVAGGAAVLASTSWYTNEV